MNWYMEVLKKYAVFEGRARRKEYWMFMLVHVIIMVLLMLLEEAIGVAIFSLPPCRPHPRPSEPGGSTIPDAPPGGSFSRWFPLSGRLY